MPEEAATIRGMLSNASVKLEAGVDLTSGSFAGHEIMLCISGVGKAFAGATTQLVITRFNPDAILNIGLAGSCVKGLPISGVIIADKIVYHDFIVDFEKEPDPFIPDGKLTALAEKACKILKIPHIRGTAATGDQFINDERVKKNIIGRTGCSCVEMEAAAIAAVAQKNGVPYTTIKVVSDDASDAAEDSFHEVFSLGAYCDRSAMIIAEILNMLPL